MNTIKLNTVGLDSKLIVKKESGGGESESGGEDIYLDSSAFDDTNYNTMISVAKRRLKSDGSIVFLPRGLFSNPNFAGEDLACMIVANTPMTDFNTGEISTIDKAMLMMEADGYNFPRITKEQFYSLETTE